MASDSSRTRIDLFFASRKRKSLSPGLKRARKKEKNARIIVDDSPGRKGNLNNYLVNSQDENNVVKASLPVCGLSGRVDMVKRKLSLEIDKVSKDEKKDACSSSTQTNHHQPPVAFEMSQKEKSQGSSATGNPAVEAGANDLLVSGAYSSELKQFSNDFLSLYCSELQSTATSPPKPETKDKKRHGSPLSIDVKEKTFKRKHRLTYQSNIEVEAVPSPEKRTEDMLSVSNAKTGASVFSTSRLEAAVSHPRDLQASLRKCGQVSKLRIDVTECYTPSASVTRQHVHQTPNSNCGRSIFSPGEAFWEEAILIADGLLPETRVPAADRISKLCNSSGKNLNKTHNKDKGNDSSLQVVGENMKNITTDVSPLPVKNLDVLFEDKNLDLSTRLCLDNMGTHKGTQPESITLNHKHSRCDHIETQHTEAQPSNLVHAAEKTNSVHVVTNGRSTCPHQEAYHNTTGSLVNEIKNSDVDNICVGAGTPTSFVPLSDRLDISTWLPSEVCNFYKRRGINRLYNWQVDCLMVEGVLQRRNLVYCASTSAGKSFVAEILMLCRVISSGKIALLVLPYVSICAEKAEHLEGLLEPLGKHVRSYYGNQGGGTLPKDTSVAVCTIEKANSLVNRLLEEGRLSEIGIIVIDELHMVGDQSRGYLLELLLTKLRYAAGEGNSASSSGESSGTSSKGDLAQGLQIVGMSATMPNVVAVADWLQAALYQTDFRPVPLEEYIKVGNTIYDKKMDIVRTIPRAADLGSKDPEHIVELCNEVVQEGHSVLIFCSSRKGCESTAKHISKFLMKFSIKLQDDSEFADIASAIDALRKSPAGLDPTLEETFPAGVAYHHAGLTVEEREVIETCYRRGLLRVLTATSTLAAGVNLPARRVIFRQPRIGRDFIDGTRYRQMAGRAGRTGIDTKGESVLICKPEEIKRITGLINESCPPLQSCLSEDKNGMTHAILEVVAGGIVQTANDIHRYVSCTLLNSTKPFSDVVKSAQDSLRWLCRKKFLEWNEGTKLYSTTPLGRAAFGSSLCPEESLIVLDDLSRAREGFVLASELHLVYLVTPINVDAEPDWELYYERFMELTSLDQSVGNRVGVSEPFLMRMAHGAPMHMLNRSRDTKNELHGKLDNRFRTNIISDEQTLRVSKRFYVALILSRLVQEVPVAEVCEAFKVARGMVQALQDNAGRFASMVSVFCERLGWHDLEGLVSKFQNRVSFGVRAEIVELTTIPFVKGSRARALYKAGLRTPVAIAEASIHEIVKAIFESSSWAAAQEGSTQRRIQLGVAKKIKNGARKIVLDKAEEARLAAFSAFTSLGYNVPQLSVPMLPKDSGNLVEEAATTTSFGDENCKTSDVAARYPSASKMSVKAAAEPKSTVSQNPTTEKSVTRDIEPDTTSDHHKRMILPINPRQTTDPNRICEQNLNNELIGSKGRKIGSDNKDNASDKGPINASSIAGGFDYFLHLWDSTQEFYFDIHFNKRSEINSAAPFEMHGIAICWENSPVYYVNLPKDLLSSASQTNECSLMTANNAQSNSSPPEKLFEIVRCRWNKIGQILEKREVRKFTWNLKVQIQVLERAAVSIRRLDGMNILEKNLGVELIDDSLLSLSPIKFREGIDMCIVAWMLWPDEERSSSPNLEKEVKRRLSSEVVAAANRSGRWKNQMRRAAHNGCCRRVAQTRALCSVLWKLLISEGLLQVLKDIEMPLVRVLADMEFWGIGVNMEVCLKARNVLGQKLRHLEKEAYKLVGIIFSLYTAADIANVLYGHLKLPIPEGRNKGKHHPSTDKSCLDLLRHEHPIIPVIREHRTLAKLLNSTLGSICSLARMSLRTQKHTIHGHWLQTSTATGRLSMEEPNLQCVEHLVEFNMHMDKNEDHAEASHYKINPREFFIPTQDNWLLLTADYSQIELRLMAHFSKDASLVELLSNPHGDVFTMMAARWTGKPEESVGSVERDQTKRLVYGILYGMGANTLAEQLGCSPDEAAQKIKSFKSSFPGVDSWLHEAVKFCRKKGYVETLKGRKRFLSKIKFGDSKEKSKAQRQAVNSICQGSAADIIKIAMLDIHSVIVEGVDPPSTSSSLAAMFYMLKGRCRILLQVHDELVLEVDSPVLNEAALLLKASMERAASLLVPLHVKLKVGKTWGSLEPFQTDNSQVDIVVPDAKISKGDTEG